MASKQTQPMPQDERDRMENVLEEMSSTMVGWFGTPDGTPSAPILMGDGTYRTVALAPGQELIFKNFYLTKTGAPTAVFEPIDAQEWVQCEFTLKKLDTFFPLFAGIMAEKMGFSGDLEEAQAVFDHILSSRKNGWRAIEEEKKRQEAELVAAEQAAIRDSNPLWGRF